MTPQVEKEPEVPKFLKQFSKKDQVMRADTKLKEQTQPMKEPPK